MKIAVLMGGTSFERKISLQTGKTVCNALEEAGHKVVTLDTTKELVPTLRSEKPDCAYIALHGKQGEDGTIQSLLEFLQIPYIGSSYSVCRRAYNKATLPETLRIYREVTKKHSSASTPKQICLARDAFKDMGAATALDLIYKRLDGGLPYAVKPSKGGSALGVHKVEKKNQLAEAILDALSYNDEVLIQEWIDGVEMSVCILGPGWNAKVLPPVEIVPRNGLYDYDARYTSGGIDAYIPVRKESLSTNKNIADRAISSIKEAAVEVYSAYGIKDLGRVDLVWDGEKPQILEVAVSPGMTEYSIFPKACEAAGYKFSEVLDNCIKEVTK